MPPVIGDGCRGIMNNAHTPGPWQVLWRGPRAFIVGVDGFSIIGRADPEECRANDRLIAAAPEQNARLIDLVCYLEGMADCLREDSGFSPDFDDLANEIVATQATIAKATGHKEESG